MYSKIKIHNSNSFEKKDALTTRSLVFWGSIIAAIVLFNSCTSNPFDDDGDIDDGPKQMTGTVRIADGASPDRVFVWMKGMNLSTYTDASGEYSFRLSDGIVDRSDVVQRDTLYFYLANYEIDKRYVDIVQGSFKYASADLGEDGVAREITMRRSLIIATDVKFLPNDVDASAPDTIRVLVNLRAEEGCFEVSNPFVGAFSVQRPVGDSTAYNLGAIIIRDIDSGEVYAIRSANVDHGADRMVPCSYDVYFLKFDFFASDIGLSQGHYEVTPYLWFEPVNVPSGLLDVIGRDKNELNGKYFQKPMKRIGGSFEIK